MMKLGNRKIVNLTAGQVIKELKEDHISKEKLEFLKESVRVSKTFSRKDNKNDL